MVDQTLGERVRGRVDQLARLRAPKRGRDVFQDARYFLPALTITTVFDVGANVGQSALEYLKALPKARIWSFEPARSTFATLDAAVGGHARVTTVNAGLADRPGVASMDVGHASDQATISADGAGGQRIRLTTMDAFCDEHGIARVDFLKIDTEGHDLLALQGAERMLTAGAIGLVEVEAGMNPENDLHVPLEQLKAYLESFGYRAFGIYDQMGEWPTKRPHLRRINAVFVAGTLIDASRRVRGGA